MLISSFASGRWKRFKSVSSKLAFSSHFKEQCVLSLAHLFTHRLKESNSILWLICKLCSLEEIISMSFDCVQRAHVTFILTNILENAIEHFLDRLYAQAYFVRFNPDNLTWPWNFSLYLTLLYVIVLLKPHRLRKTIIDFVTRSVQVKNS